MPRHPHRVFENMTTGPWLVELRGDQNVLGELFDHFSFRELGKDKTPTYYLEQVYGQIFLRSQTFHGIADPREVQCEGERLLNLMNGILKLQVPGRSNDVVDVGAVFVEELPSRLPEPVFGVRPQFVISYKSSPLESARLVELTDTDFYAEQLLQLYGSSNPVWWTLLKMMEIITQDMQEAIHEEGSPSKEKLEHLRATGQQYALENNQPTTNLLNQDSVSAERMPLIEARVIIHSLLERWVIGKLSHMPQEMALSLRG